LGRFWQFWAILGSFGQIQANFVAFAIMTICPNFG
jgi:hypothetical protein